MSQPPQVDIESQSQQPATQSILKQSSHPVALIFQVLFRTLALLIYIFGEFMGLNFVLNFVLVTLLLAFDFWTVKNITGRLLVGLRWWNDIKENGENEWVFESRGEGYTPNPVDSRIFWWTLYGFPVAWCVFMVVRVLTFSITWIPLVMVALSLTMANAIGYTKCNKDAQKRLMGNGISNLGTVFNIMNRFSSN